MINLIVCALCAFCGLFPFLCQRVEIVSLFGQQAFRDESLDDIKHRGPRLRIVAPGFKQLV